jgi:hypothetical protein
VRGKPSQPMPHSVLVGAKLPQASQNLVQVHFPSMQRALVIFASHGLAHSKSASPWQHLLEVAQLQTPSLHLGAVGEPKQSVQFASTGIGPQVSGGSQITAGSQIH